MDKETMETLEFNRLGAELPSSSMKKKGMFGKYKETKPGFHSNIMNAHNFVPMGSRITSGKGRGICIRTGNQTLQGVFFRKKNNMWL